MPCSPPEVQAVDELAHALLMSFEGPADGLDGEHPLPGEQLALSALFEALCGGEATPAGRAGSAEMAAVPLADGAVDAARGSP
jgi:hypothetical protein